MALDSTPSANRFRFRAWHSETKKIIDLHAITPLALDANLKQDGVFIPFDGRIILMQSTGLTDGDGKEIFEGDIVHFRDWDNGYGHDDDEIDEGIGQVLWGHNANNNVGYTHGFWVEIINNSKYKPFGFARGIEMQYIEVIGNIYDNPELLNTEKTS